jgi:hypothetical protein
VTGSVDTCVQRSMVMRVQLLLGLKRSRPTTRWAGGVGGIVSEKWLKVNYNS